MNNKQAKFGLGDNVWMTCTTNRYFKNYKTWIILEDVVKCQIISCTTRRRSVYYEINVLEGKYRTSSTIAEECLFATKGEALLSLGNPRTRKKEIRKRIVKDIKRSISNSKRSLRIEARMLSGFERALKKVLNAKKFRGIVHV